MGVLIMKEFMYKILQIDDSRDTNYLFMRWEFAKSHEFDIHDYKEVYLGSIWCEEDDVNAALEKLFVKFNQNHPIDFHGHSLSVSDIVVINNIHHYCDSLGWTCIQDYVGYSL